MAQIGTLNREASIGQSLAVDFVDLDLKIETMDRKGKLSRHILHNLSGSFQPGKLTAIIGPSGCGKSTLMNYMSGRMAPDGIPNSSFSGTVSLNGKVIEPIYYKQQFAYVMADDALFATTTPREAFNFVGKLRLPHLSEEERSMRAEAMLASLGLIKCADTFIGNAIVKGISSGEKKRTAVGIELLPNPDLIFLDEPTTGLDSYTSLELIRMVKGIADSGKTVLCVIHQPSSEIFELFDDVMFMNKGHIMYHGPVLKVVDYFASFDFECPLDYNPADYIMYAMQTMTHEQVLQLSDAWKSAVAPVRAQVLESRAQMAKSEIALELKPIRRASPATQLNGLFWRELRRTVRDPSPLFIRTGISLFLGIVVGFIFWQVGQSTGPGGTISTSHRGGLTNACVFAMFTSGQSMLINLPFDRPVILREYANGLYSITNCILARLLVELPIVFMQTMILAVLIYFLEGFVGEFMLLVLAMFLLGCATGCLALMFGSYFKEVEKAVEMSFILFVPQILFSGFFISIDQIPSLFQWAQWLCCIKYAVNIAYIAEFTDLTGYQQVFDTTNVDSDLLWMYIVVLVGIAIVTATSAIFLLRWRSKSVF